MLCRAETTGPDPTRPKLLYVSHICVNQVRVRDVIDGCDATLEVHKLENMKAGLSVEGGEVVVGDPDTRARVVMKLRCGDQTEKEEWVRAVNKEVKMLRNMANALSGQQIQLTNPSL